MKCKQCTACRKGYFASKPNAYVCIGVKEPFIISDINVECTEYPENRTKPPISFLMIGFDYSPEDIACMHVSRCNGKSLGVIRTIFGDEAIELYEQLIGDN